MSDKEWYEGLPANELEGKHVHAVYGYGTVVDGELCRNGRVRIDHRDEDGAPVFVIDAGRVVNTVAHILSVSLVWDERDWEQIRTEDISKADAVVVNGHLLAVTRAVRDVFLVEGFNPVPASFVSCALRRRSKLPTEPGYYRSDSDGLLYLTGDSEWWLIKADCVVHLSSVPTYSLPLTPVHFVDGRAE